MKSIFTVLLLCLTSCSLNTVAINEDLKKAIAFGKIVELNDIDPNKEKDLLLRLYRAPDNSENCFVETHGICKYKYFLSVSSFDEYPTLKIYELQEKGEITKITWLDEDKNDYVELELEMNAYTQEALTNNDKLVNVASRIKLGVSLETISEQKLN